MGAAQREVDDTLEQLIDDSINDAFASIYRQWEHYEWPHRLLLSFFGWQWSWPYKKQAPCQFYQKANFLKNFYPLCFFFQLSNV